MGVEQCKHRTKELLYWTGMNGHGNVVSNCTKCSMYQKVIWKSCSYTVRYWVVPGQKSVGADLCKCNGKPYLVLTEYYSGFIEVNQVYQKYTTNQVLYVSLNLYAMGSKK